MATIMEECPQCMERVCDLAAHLDHCNAVGKQRKKTISGQPTPQPAATANIEVIPATVSKKKKKKDRKDKKEKEKEKDKEKEKEKDKEKRNWRTSFAKFSRIESKEKERVRREYNRSRRGSRDDLCLGTSSYKDALAEWDATEGAEKSEKPRTPSKLSSQSAGGAVEAEAVLAASSSTRASFRDGPAEPSVKFAESQPPPADEAPPPPTEAAPSAPVLAAQASFDEGDEASPKPRKSRKRTLSMGEMGSKLLSRAIGGSTEEEASAPSGAGGRRGSKMAEAGLASIMIQLAEQKFTDQDVWEGDQDVIALLRKHQSVILAVAGKGPKKTSLVAFHLPASPEFRGQESVSYKIKHTLTCKQILQLVFRKLKASPEGFCLMTTRGTVLEEGLTLMHYGLGSLFSSFWELRVVQRPENKGVKPVAVGRVQREMSDTPLFSPSSGTMQCHVRLVLPEAEVFGGVKTQVMNVKITMKIRSLISNICKRWKLKPSKWVLCVKQRGKYLVLDRDRDTSYYGLGSRLRRWTLHLLAQEDLGSDDVPYEVAKDLSSEIGWVQIEECSPTLEEVLKMLIEIDESATASQAAAEAAKIAQQEEVEQLRNKNAHQLKKLDKLSSAKSSLSKDLKEYKSECRVKEERLVGLGEEVSALQARVSSLADAEESLSAELAAAKEELELSRAAATKIEDELSETNAKLEEVKAASKEELKQRDEELQIARQSLRQEKNVVESKDRELQALASDLGEQKDALAKLRKEVQENVLQNLDLQTVIKEHEEYTQKLKSDHKERVASLENLIREGQDQRAAEVKELNEKIRALESEGVTQKALLEENAKELESLRARLQSIESSHKQQLASVQSKLDAAVKEAKEHKAIAAEEKNRSAQFEARCRTANEKVLSFTEQVDMLKEHLEDSEIRREELMDQVLLLQSQRAKSPAPPPQDSAPSASGAVSFAPPPSTAAPAPPPTPAAPLVKPIATNATPDAPDMPSLEERKSRRRSLSAVNLHQARFALKKAPEPEKRSTAAGDPGSMAEHLFTALQTRFSSVNDADAEDLEEDWDEEEEEDSELFIEDTGDDW